jgi:hypothetical protein
LTGVQKKKKLSERRIVKIRQGKPRSTRAERAERVRDALFEAAAEVVGKYGYVGASISRITAKAKVAQGTFYNYFESRQHLLDQLLPVLGEGQRWRRDDEYGIFFNQRTDAVHRIEHKMRI